LDGWTPEKALFVGETEPKPINQREDTKLLDDNDPRNQCVFLRGYRIADRNFLKRFLSKFKIPSGSRRFQGIDPVPEKYKDNVGSSATGSSSIREQGSTTPSDSLSESATRPDLPSISIWGVLMKYILEDERRPQLALVHDNDFSVVQSEDLTSIIVLQERLHKVKPKIYLVDSVGMFEPTYKAYSKSLVPQGVSSAHSSLGSGDSRFDQPDIPAPANFDILPKSQITSPHRELADIKSLEIQMISHRKTNGPDHPDTLKIMSALSNIYRSQGRWSEAEGIQVELLKLSEIKLIKEKWISCIAVQLL